MNGTNAKVDAFVSGSEQWGEAYEQLRRIVLDRGLTEAYKWMHPCYTLDGKNVVLIQGFKEYCALLFPKGALLKDPQGILVQQTANTQAARQIRFTRVQEILELEPVLKAYIDEAIAAEKAGLELDLKETADFAVAEEFQSKLDELPALKDAFEALTPGRQRAYLLHFSQAKQSKTRASRVEKAIPRILEGKGLNDR